MSESFARARVALARPALLAAIVFAFVFLIAFLRRGSNLVRPQLWAEDGTFMVPHFLAEGWWPLKGDEGYLTIASHLVTNLALTIAPHSYVTLSTWLTWIFMGAVAVFVAAAPTVLRGGFFLALACFLVPTDPEVFGVPLYAFWWAGLALFVLPFWRPEPTQVYVRTGALLLAGLSSPIAIVTAPLMAVRALILRHKVDAALAVLAMACAALQIYFIAIDPHIRVAQEYTTASPRIIVERFFGWFAWETVRTNVRSDLLVAGIAVIALAGWTAWKLPDRRVGAGLLYLIAATVATSASRMDVANLHVLSGGPRYFFYPFILLSWLFIQGLYARRCATGRVICGVVLVGALYNALASGWSRDHWDLPLDRHLASCLHFERYALPLQVDGSQAATWYQDYPRAYCARLGGDTRYEPARLIPYSVRHVEEGAKGPSAARAFMIGGGTVAMAIERESSLLFETMPDKPPISYEVKGGPVTFVGELLPCLKRCRLDFSSGLLPDEFIVTFTGGADSFAVGIPEN